MKFVLPIALITLIISSAAAGLMLLHHHLNGQHRQASLAEIELDPAEVEQIKKVEADARKLEELTAILRRLQESGEPGAPPVMPLTAEPSQKPLDKPEQGAVEQGAVEKQPTLSQAAPADAVGGIQRNDELQFSESTFDPKVSRLLPSNPWLKIAMAGRIMGEHPFGDQSECDTLPAPARVGVAFYSSTFAATPSTKKKSGAAQVQLPPFVIVLPATSNDFWTCLRAKVLSTGGKKMGKTEGIELLKAKNGYLYRSPSGAVIFSSTMKMSQRGPPLLQALPSRPELPKGTKSEKESTMLAQLRVYPRKRWLEDAGQLSLASPLRFIRGFALDLDESGQARGELRCNADGCSELIQFLDRAKVDLATTYPWAAEYGAGLSLGQPQTRWQLDADGAIQGVPLAWSAPESFIEGVMKKLGAPFAGLGLEQ
ncbi:MAG: hypothetical protein MK135_01085 [Polyangiaceae bacterium]|nr:hypothetical protein [Polyangiaceae bacterium]